MAHTNGIGGSPLLQTLLTQAEATGAAKGARRTSEPSGTTATDQTQWSTEASALLRGAEQGDVRAEKVQQIQTAIATGNYNVSASDVADALVRSLLR